MTGSSIVSVSPEGETLISSSDTTLVHYGVKGMKWGVRKERRAENKRTRQLAKAEKYDARATKADARIQELKSKKVNVFNRSSIERDTKLLIGIRDQAEKDAQLKRDGKLSTNERRLAIGATAVGVAVLAYGSYKVADSGELNRMMQKGKSFLEGREGDPGWKKNDALRNKALDIDGIQRDVIDKINPDYGKLGTKDNCRRCTFAYEMRRRGFDVKATKSISATGQDNIGLYNATNAGGKVIRNKAGALRKFVQEESAREKGQSLNNPLSEFLSAHGAVGTKHVVDPDAVAISPLTGRKISTFHNNIFKSLSTQPDGARGELGVTWKAGGGHSMAWEVVGGKPVIFDTQNGKRYTGPADLEKVGGMMESAGFTRLDNVPLNVDFLMRWLQDAD